MTTEVKDLINGIEKKHAEIETALKSAGTDAKGAIAAAEKALDEIKTLGNRLTEIEQKTADDVKRGTQAPATLGSQVIAADSFKRFVNGEQTKTRIEIKAAITGQTGGNSSNVLVPTDRQDGIVAGPLRALRLRDVIAGAPTTSNSIEFTRETGFTSNAAHVAEAAQRPESSAGFELVTHSVRTIGHFIRASKQILADAPALAAYLDKRLTYGVNSKIDGQILLGDGAGQNLSGLTQAANSSEFNPTAGEQQLDAINRAVNLTREAGYEASAIVLNPSDWGAIERLKGGDGHYIIGNPTGLIGPVLWSVPVIVTAAMPVGQFMVGALDVAAMYFDRQQTVVELSESDGDNFTKGLVTAKAEARGALATFLPAAIHYGELLAA